MKQQIWTFVLFWLISLSTGADITVTCISTSVPTSVCVLPCTSPYNGVIHWEKDEKIVHSFFKKADQLAYQDADFKDRTSLFQDQIPQGNISLMLRKIRPKDEGRYKCYTATDSDNKEQFVLLKVRVPLKQVDLKKTNEGISCVAKDIYPKPGISWYRDKSPVESFVKTTVDKEGLFSVSSVFPQSVTENTTYICSINTEEEIFTASLRKERAEIYPGQDATIHCPVSKENAGNITLWFGESFIKLSYSQTTQQSTIKDQWRGKTLHLAHDGTVTIHNLGSAEDTGTYICERTTAQSRYMVETSLKITSASHHVGTGVGIALGVLLLIIIIAGVIFWKKRGKKEEKAAKVSTEGKPAIRENHCELETLQSS
ncbi:hypothetical protein HF521_010559 [Silurus meridionalis]|uniref:Ig-like domain-containing protein n=1 Tax=Silurus meridionalis TaxID=175797 RepID=A0A8T0AGQ4_SILME|nr:hypothetical protein HF521_010559 [Silurus meridionalis]